MKKKILIVDDEIDILDILRYNLEKEGYDVVYATNGQKAIDKAYKHKPDLVLLDIMMPKKDGMEVCQEMRSDTLFDSTYIIFLTARGEEYSEIAGFEAGADDYVVKPIRPRSLLSRIENILKRERVLNKEEKLLEFDGLIIDIAKFKIFTGDKELNFTKKEFNIILLLASQPERVFTRQEIYSKIWGSDTIVGERTLDVHIRKIRKKIDNKYIKTVKGVGYSFIH